MTGQISEIKQSAAPLPMAARDEPPPASRGGSRGYDPEHRADALALHRAHVEAARIADRFEPSRARTPSDLWQSPTRLCPRGAAEFSSCAGRTETTSSTP